MKDADGSLSLHMGQRPPAGGPQSNWLPAPDAPFYLVLRLYHPQARLLEGRYAFPRWNGWTEEPLRWHRPGRFHLHHSLLAQHRDLLAAEASSRSTSAVCAPCPGAACVACRGVSHSAYGRPKVV